MQRLLLVCDQIDGRFVQAVLWICSPCFPNAILLDTSLYLYAMTSFTEQWEVSGQRKGSEKFVVIYHPRIHNVIRSASLVQRRISRKRNRVNMNERCSRWCR